MKKAVITVMAVIMTLTAVLLASGCTGTTQNNDNETLRAEIEDLKDRVEDLENKNNVFWTDKAEYSEHETMTVYFKDTAVFSIVISSDPALDGGVEYVNASFTITALSVDLYSLSIVPYCYLEWESGVCEFNDRNPSNILCKKNAPTQCNFSFSGASDAITYGEKYSVVICVPGTKFELARFVNVTMKK